MANELASLPIGQLTPLRLLSLLNKCSKTEARGHNCCVSDEEAAAVTSLPTVLPASPCSRSIFRWTTWSTRFHANVISMASNQRYLVQCGLGSQNLW